MRIITISLFLWLLIGFNQLYGQLSSMSQYIFGHSLINHAIPTTPIPSNETSVPHWMALLAVEASKTYSASGQYGFLQQHRNLPPTAQWGFDTVTPAWDSDSSPFSAANFDNVLVTAGNFMQWQGPSVNYFMDTVSPISCTIDILDWVKAQEPTCRFYIYENWPDMSGFISSGTFPPTQAEWVAYNNYIDSGFHDWWIEYQDSMLSNRSSDSVRMIPVGPIISKLLMSSPLNQIPITDLYEDDAPHGKPTIYFLAGLVTYMATYEEKAPATYQVPSIIDSLVASNYSSIVDTIWNELLKFNIGNTSNSRVFFTNGFVASLAKNEQVSKPFFFPNPSSGLFQISQRDFKIRSVHDMLGREIQVKSTSQNFLDLTTENKGVYNVVLEHGDSKQVFRVKIILK